MFKDLFSLKGRVALVTGGSRGIGKMIAGGFLAYGASKVYITARKAGPCEETAKELTAAYDGECIALPIDMSTVEGCNKLAAEFMKREQKLDILVNNAGAAWGSTFDEFPEAGWDKVMNLNVKSLFFLTKALAKPLRAAATREKPAKVINIASIDGLSVNPMETYSYQASKAAVIHLTRRMAARPQERANRSLFADRRRSSRAHGACPFRCRDQSDAGKELDAFLRRRSQNRGALSAPCLRPHLTDLHGHDRAAEGRRHA